MANERMYLLHTPSGYHVCIGKRMGWGWYGAPSSELVQELFDMVDSQEAAGDQDAFEIALESDPRLEMSHLVTLQMNDHKGYDLIDRPLDWQDRLVLWACVLAVLILAAMILGGLV